MNSSFQTVVLGLGAMGSAALYQLALRNVKVLGIDMLAPPHSLGSTHGETRITRQAIGEDKAYTALSLRSYELFEEIEQKTGERVLERTGGLIISSKKSQARLHVSDFFGGTIAAAREFGIRHDLLTGKDIRKRFPQFRVNDDENGYYEYDAGYLRPEVCVRTQLALAKDLGAIVHLNERVIEFKQDQSGVTIKTDQSEYKADNLIVTSGPWLPEFVDGDLRKRFQVTRQVLYWFDVEENYDQFRVGNFPVFIWEPQTTDSGIYGIPAINGSLGGIKIAPGGYGEATSANGVDRSVGQAEIEQMYEQCVQPNFNGINRKCLKTSVCLYTLTPDSHFVIGKHPQYSRILICSACSGHGFKHSAAIGECLAELVTTGDTKLKMDLFRIADKTH